MKTKKLLHKLMGIHNPPEILTQLEDLGFRDTYELKGDYHILQYRGHHILYDSKNDEVVSWHMVEPRK